MAESGDLAREELPLASIVADRVAIQPRIQLDEEAIEAYAEAVEKLPPVVVFRDPERRSCRWYEWRPEICRDFAVGSKECQKWRQEYGIGLLEKKGFPDQ